MTPLALRSLKYVGTTVLFVTTWAAAQTTPPEVDSEGLYKQPICGYTKTVQKSLEVQVGKVPTGIKATSAKWSMEIYANPKDGNWTLLGLSRDSSVPDYKICRLASSISIDAQYTTQKWYAIYFK